MKRKPNPYVQRYKKLHRQKKKAENFLRITLPAVNAVIEKLILTTIALRNVLIQLCKNIEEEDKENKNENS